MGIRTRLVLVVGVLAGVVVSACSADATPTPRSVAEAAACAAIQAWSDQMRTLTGMDASTASIESVQAQRDVVVSAWDGAKTSLEGVKAANKEAVTAAYVDLETALKTIPKDVPVADAIAGVKAAAVPLRAAHREMADGLGCTIVTPY